MWPTHETRPRAVKASAIRRAAAASGATCFSMRTCTPASASCTATSSWAVVGTQTTARSRPAATSFSTEGKKVKCWVERSERGAGSAMPTSSTPGSELRTRAWWRPIWPKPTSPARRSGTVGPFVDGRHDAGDLVGGEAGPDGQRQHLPGGAFGLGELEVQVVRREPVRRDGVVDGAVDATSVEPRGERIPVGGADGVLVPDRFGLRRHRRCDDAGQLLVVRRGDGSALLVPARQAAQLHAAHRRGQV